MLEAQLIVATVAHRCRMLTTRCALCSIVGLRTDVVMPRLGGRSLAAYMAAYFPGIKVLFTSGYAEHGIVHHGQLDHSAAFLAKPFSAAALAHKVRAVLDS